MQHRQWQRRFRATIARVRPRPTPADDNFIGFDKYRKLGAYHWDEMESSADYRGKIEFIASMLRPSWEVLDVGCGDGAYVFHIAQRCRAVVGVDADSDAVRLASRELGRRHVMNAKCLRMPISDLSLEALGRSQPFDLVYSMDVIEHLPQPKQLGERLAPMVASQGTVVIGTPCYLRDDLVSPYHVREYTLDQLVAELDWLDLDGVTHLPMRRLDGLIHDDGFLVAVGRVRT